jgi:hypothetical protein
MYVPPLAERITLLCQESSVPSSIPSSLGRVVPAVLVSGLEFGDDLLLSPRYGFTRISERELTLPAPLVSRLVGFFATHLTQDPRQVPAWNCHYFASAMSREQQLADAPKNLAALTSGSEVGADELEPGLPYAIRDAGGNVMHSVLGIDKSDECLSVVGMCRPLKIMDTHDAITLWGTTIHKALPTNEA